MKEIDSPKDAVPDTVLSKQGFKAIVSTAGGAALLFVSVLPSIAVLAIGFITAGLGISGIASKDREDKKPGILVTIAGTLLIFSRVVSPIRRAAIVALLVVGLGLLCTGLLNGLKFLSGLYKKRQG
ncbi:hypothetical protein ACYULU_12930 [Breznakiellaceae bacterium SP9]